MTNVEETTKRPFAHVATAEVLKELNAFESSVKQDYDRCLPKVVDTVPHMAWDNVTVESVLGEGGFSFVFHVLVEDHGYALKCLKAKAVATTDDLTYNAMDLYTEAHILSRLNHPNIIHLHGVANNTLADSYKSSDGYFVLLDIMKETLFEKLATWRNKPKSDKKVTCSKSGIVRRLRHIALPVVEAMAYLHSHQMVLRDLKPENIGFDHTGQVKLFDFGLARVLSLVEEGDVAGSICYMAPEIMLEQGTYLGSDVYSFAIVCWELCTLQIPLARFTNIQQIQQQVAQGNWRPPLSSIPSKTLRQLIQKSWARNPVERPEFGQISKVLNEVCSKEKYSCDDRMSSQSMHNRLLLPTTSPSKQERRMLRTSCSEGHLASAR